MIPIRISLRLPALLLLACALMLAACGGEPEVERPKFTFNPPDPVHFRGRSTTTRVTYKDAELMAKTVNIVESAHEITKTADGWVMRTKPIEMTSTLNGEPVAERLLSALSNIEYVVLIDSVGRAYNVHGYEALDTLIDTLLGPNVTPDIRRQFSTDQFVRRELAEWNGRIANFVGMEVVIDSPIYNEASFPVPGTNPFPYYLATRITDTTRIDGKLCARIDAVAHSDPVDLSELVNHPLEDLLAQVEVTDDELYKASVNSTRLYTEMRRLVEVNTLLIRSEETERQINVIVPDPDDTTVTVTNRLVETTTKRFEYDGEG